MLVETAVSFAIDPIDMMIKSAGITPPDDEDEERALRGWLTYSIPKWTIAGYTEQQAVEAAKVWKTTSGKADVMRRYWAGDFASAGYAPDLRIVQEKYTVRAFDKDKNLYGEIFLYDEFGRLRWFPNEETIQAWGYKIFLAKPLPISWFYDKPIAESITDVKTGKIYSASETPNYELYRYPPEVETKGIEELTCPQCKSTLRIIPPSPEKMVTQVFNWKICPVCGYPELYLAPTGGYTVQIINRKPWPPIPPESPVITGILDQYEKQISQLEEAFAMTRGGERYNNSYATISTHAEKLLEQMVSLYSGWPGKWPPFTDPAPTWTSEQKSRLQGLINRVKTLINNCRIAAEQIKPVPTIPEAIAESEDRRVTEYLQESQQTGTPDLLGFIRRSDISTPTVLPVVPQYSVQERFLSMLPLAEQAPLEFATAEVTPARSKLPYYIIGGLGLVAVVSYIRKKKGVGR